MSESERALGLHRVSPEVRRMARAPWPAYALVAIEGMAFYFMLPRKCASNTMKVALNALDETFPRRANSYVTADAVERHDYTPRVAVVRHPITRFISCWRHFCFKVGASLMKMPGLYDRMSWDEFFEACMSVPDEEANYHYRSMHLEVVLGRMPDHILTCEMLEADWAVLSAEYRWPSVKLGRLNASTAELPRITKAQRDKLTHRYREDFRLFHYSPITF